jgi:hypothetical protein
VLGAPDARGIVQDKTAPAISSRGRGGAACIRLRSPTICLVVQKHDHNDKWDRYSEKPKQNGHEKSPSVMLVLDDLFLDLASPRAVPSAAAFPSGRSSGKGTDEQRQR